MTGEPQTNLPNSWKLADLCEVAELNPRPDKSAYTGNPMVSFVPMPGVKAGTGAIDVDQTRSLEEVKEGYTPFQEGDVLFAKITPCMENGKMAVVPPLKNGLGFGSTEFHVLRPYCEISAQYIYFFISSASFRRGAEHNMTGAVGQRRVPTSYLVDQSVPVPPAREQRRIVAKIEELFSELDKGIESLKTARRQLEVYRQSVLKHAFEGKLTAQWRAENKDKLETPEKLLVRIKKEQAAHYERKLKEWRTAAEKWQLGPQEESKPNKPRAPKPLTKLDESAYPMLPQLPESWVWEKLGWMTCGVEYGTAAKSSKSGTVPVLRMGNIQKGRFDWSDLVYTSDDNEISEYLLQDGDILFNRTNSPELVGKTAIFRGSRRAIFAGYLIRVNQICIVVESQYLNLFLNSDVARQYGDSVKTDGVNQSNINGTKLVNYPFPYCSAEEQREVVRILEKTLSIVDDAETKIDVEIQKAVTLRQSILTKAFSSQLVPQDPHDEPASVLLDCIRAEREKAAKNNRPKKTKKRKTTA